MGTWTEISKVDELKDGSMKAVDIHGREILLARVDGKYYATGNRCPHLGGNLSEGKLEGTVITCPRHASQFDLADGRAIRWTNWTGPLSAIGKLLRPAKPLATYSVKVAGDSVLVEV